MFVDSGRARLAYDVTGETGGTGGQDVLLMHAGVSDRRSWDALVGRLSPRHRCVAFDQRGFGETVYEPEDGWSPVADALAVLDAAGISRAVVVACSMGGSRAIDLTLAHPDRVAGLVLIGTGVRGAPQFELDPGSPLAKLAVELDAAEERGDVEEILRLETRIWLDGPTAAEGRVGGPARASFEAANRRATEAPDPGAVATAPDAWPRLGEITFPTLVMTGRLDVEDLLEMNPRLAERIPGAQFRWLDAVAHVPHVEGDETTLAAISEFIDSFS